MQTPPHKIILAGDGGTGKSTLISTKRNNKFCSSNRITIGVDCESLIYSINGYEFTYLIYDLGGQQRFHFLHDSYIKGAKAAIVLYDLTRIQSFEHISKWFTLLIKENPEMKIILCGSKKDLVQPEDCIHFYNQWNNIQNQIAGNNNVVAHIQFSSRNYENIDEIFTILDEQVRESVIQDKKHSIVIKN